METEKTISEQKANQAFIDEDKSGIGDPTDYDVETTEVTNNHKALNSLIFEESSFKIVRSILCFLILVGGIKSFITQESNNHPFKIIQMFIVGYYMFFPSSLLSIISFWLGSRF